MVIVSLLFSHTAPVKLHWAMLPPLNCNAMLYCTVLVLVLHCTSTSTSTALGNRACCREVNFSKSLAWVFFWCLFMFRIGLQIFKNVR